MQNIEIVANKDDILLYYDGSSEQCSVKSY